ncbi:fasciclin domain-containing protein [Paradesertivirga mongoliensis]|uniref:Fasciclin domain-containing protein n=1 Tax=Paradesertivirga mongoliensis TaxID=2100740 RepID=A0ABW4ZQK2_9SPHI|nr:fasciclin domain-containing protein [Pedobacter mongoliensis]
MKTQKLISNPFIALLLGIMMMIAVGCKKASIVDLTSNDVNITGYLDKYPDQFSEFRKVLELSETSSFLQAYGAYTLFLPTNDAVKAFLNEKGLSSVEQMSKEELLDIVTFHVVPDSIKTPDFTDGKLRNATMYGQYLVTGAVSVNGASSIQIDKQAKLVTGNISVGNGVIHVIDKVMKPAPLTVAQTLEADPKYSIFTAALKLTGYFERLNKNPKTNPEASEQYLTVFAETDEALKTAGFNNLDDLVQRYSKFEDPSKPGNPLDPADSLNLYVAYHITKGAHYFVDIVNPVRLPTLAVKGINTKTKSKTEIVIDEVTINGVVHPGAPVLRETGDLSARNGVVHAVNQHYKIVFRPAQALYWDVADQPEFRAQAGFGSADITWDLKKSKPMANLKWNDYAMVYDWMGSKGFRGDVLRTQLADPRTGNARANYIEYHTPYLAPGRYKLWVCYLRAGSNGAMTFYFNGVRLNRGVNMRDESKTDDWTDEQREQNGWKRYMGPVTTPMNDGMGRLLGVVEVTEGGTQILRQELGGFSYHNNYYMDMIHFIPERQEQIWPRFWANGRIQQKGEPD